mmetsp:Transcript_87448/g.136879  ORF Transcript_87448/g.136879 Transcript_87448/m.136879 type:complete len:657 (+) Transcript_87448:43-2013(+)
MQFAGDGSVWDEAIENTRRLLEESKKQIELLRKQSHVQKVSRDPYTSQSTMASSMSTMTSLDSVGESLLPGLGERGFLPSPAVSDPAVSSSEVPCSPAPKSSARKTALGQAARRPPVTPRDAPNKGVTRSRSQRSNDDRSNSQKVSASLSSPRDISDRSHRGAAGQRAQPSFGRSASQRVRGGARKSSYMDPTGASEQKQKGKAFGTMLKKGSGAGGGVPQDDLRSERSSGSKDFIGTSSVHSQPHARRSDWRADTEWNSSVLSEGCDEADITVVGQNVTSGGGVNVATLETAGCGVASGGGSGFGGGSLSQFSGGFGGRGGAGSISVLSSCSGGLPNDTAGMTPGVAQVRTAVNEADELASLFDSMGLKTDAIDGLKAAVAPSSGIAQPEDMVAKFERILQDRRMNQMRLEEVEAKLTKLKQENVDLVMENFNLRAQQVPRSLSMSASCHAPAGLREASAVRAITGPPRTGSTSVKRPGSLANLVARSRSESPGTRQAWATAVVPSSSSVGPYTAVKVSSKSSAAASPPVSPRVPVTGRSSMVAHRSPLRQVTPTPERDYGRFPQLHSAPVPTELVTLAQVPSYGMLAVPSLSGGGHSGTLVTAPAVGLTRVLTTGITVPQGGSLTTQASEGYPQAFVDPRQAPIVVQAASYPVY